MRFEQRDPPRIFEVGRGKRIRLKDCGRIALDPDEQITLVTESGAEYDLCRKVWGFYATPSLNGRLRAFGLRALLVRSPEGKYHVFLVEAGKEGEMERYLQGEGHHIVCWLDNDQALEELEKAIGG